MHMCSLLVNRTLESQQSGQHLRPCGAPSIHLQKLCGCGRDTPFLHLEFPQLEGRIPNCGNNSRLCPPWKGDKQVHFLVNWFLSPIHLHLLGENTLHFPIQNRITSLFVPATPSPVLLPMQPGKASSLANSNTALSVSALRSKTWLGVCIPAS